MAFNLRNYLPSDYQVGPHDCIIGRGKKCTQNPGNRRFRAIIEATLDAYSNAPTKGTKSEIIMQVLSQVRADNGVGFVKPAAGGRFVLVEEASCRIAIAQAFRDALSGTYKSSKKHKAIRRLERKSIQGKSVPMPSLVSHATVNFDPIKPAALLPSSASASINMFHLRDILNEATSLAFQFENEQMQALEEPFPLTFTTTEPAADDVFSMLFSAFGKDQAEFALDPFEPTPIAEGNSNSYELPFYNSCAPMAA
ncbi:Nitrilase family, member 2 [Seminavis robusta]|uniref:Nitrilase family, member 2 n=1 Tax=Seminavis robusta TaxID=568900 RepID=A0A9N8E880_9STRA|nr:Nitrilase family, member 2 [Seminavis robusta]|eukprot:Sro728_g193720.1 Nitrilase family, member 2 (253) ;mRNA; f:27250-28008